MSMPPRTFISYSHDSLTHKQLVLGLADKLRDNGVNAFLDQYEQAPSEGWTRWMESQITAADYVLLVCTENYYERVYRNAAPGVGLGAIWESSLIHQLLYESGSVNPKFIPVLPPDGSAQHIPLALRSVQHYTPFDDDGFWELYRRLTAQPAVLMPKLGRQVALPPMPVLKTATMATPAVSSMSDIMTREELAILRSYERFSEPPSYINPPADSATQERPRFVVRPMRAGVNGYPAKEDLWAVVELSQRDRYIRGSSDLTLTTRASLYTSWFKMFPHSFALLERIPADQNGTSIIGNTAILPLKPDIMDRVARGTLKVVELEACDFAVSAADRILLFDTWVLHGDYKLGQCEDADAPGELQSCQHHGFGNALTLKHLGILWEPGTHLQLYVEPSAEAMERLMTRLRFASAAKSELTKKLLLLDYDPDEPLTRHNALHHKLTEDVIASLQQYRSWWTEEWL